MKPEARLDLERSHVDVTEREHGHELCPTVTAAVDHELAEEWTRYLGRSDRRPMRHLGTSLLHGIEQALHDLERSTAGFERNQAVGPWTEVLEHALSEADAG